MYKNIAWNNFCKTGNIESFVEYRKLEEITKNIRLEDLGETLNEVNKGEGNSNKRDII